MRLLECRIENFGKISQEHIRFDQNFTQIFRENGWGKSTLSAFIKVMLFGFDGERKQGILNERKKYQPWQGGTYGGKLSLQVGEKRYQIHRVFGANQGKDVFELRDLDTNLISRDYSSNIGEELLLLDSTSFQRTVWIAQNGERNLDATGKIHAKLGNLAENTEDMAGYEKAMERISKRLTELNGRSSNAVLQRLKQEIASLQTEVRQRGDIEKQIAERLEERRNNLAKRDILKERRSKIIGEKEKILTKIAESKGAIEVTELSNEERSRLEQLKLQFAIGLPTKSDIQKALNDCEKIKYLKYNFMHHQLTDADRIKLNQYEKLFKKGIPTKIELDQIIYSWNLKENKKQEIQENQKLLAQAQMKAGQVKKENKKDFGILLLIIMILMLAIFLLTRSFIYGLLFLVGTLTLAISLYIYRQQNRVMPMEQEVLAQQIEMDIEKKSVQSLEREIVGFFRRYDLIHQIQYLPDIVYDWKKARQEYVELIEKRDRAENYNPEEELQELLTKQKNFLNSYGVDVIAEARSAEKEIMQLLEDSNEYLRLAEKENAEKRKKQELDDWLEDSLKSLEENNPTKRKNENSFLISMDKKIETIGKEIEELEFQYVINHRELLNLDEKKEEIEEAENRLARAEEELQECQLKVDMLQKTKEYMELAKTSFSEKYSNPILQAFRKYFQLLTEEDATEYLLDANIHLTFEKMGLQREINTQSAGYQDLIGICMRLALVDAMYQEEKPFLLLDDPFINLDDEKLQRGMKFLQEVSKEYQVIYFTCHESRKSSKE